MVCFKNGNMLPGPTLAVSAGTRNSPGVGSEEANHHGLPAWPSGAILPVQLGTHLVLLVILFISTSQLSAKSAVSLVP